MVECGIVSGLKYCWHIDNDDAVNGKFVGPMFSSVFVCTIAFYSSSLLCGRAASEMYS